MRRAATAPTSRTHSAWWQFRRKFEPPRAGGGSNPFVLGTGPPSGGGAPVDPPRVSDRRQPGRDARAHESSPRPLGPARPRARPGRPPCCAGPRCRGRARPSRRIRPRARSPRTEPSQPLVRPVEIGPGTVVGVAKPEIIGRRGQIRVGPVVPYRVARVVDGACQIVGSRSKLAGPKPDRRR